MRLLTPKHILAAEREEARLAVIFPTVLRVQQAAVLDIQVLQEQEARELYFPESLASQDLFRVY